MEVRPKTQKEDNEKFRIHVKTTKENLSWTTY